VGSLQPVYLDGFKSAPNSNNDASNIAVFQLLIIERIIWRQGWDYWKLQNAKRTQGQIKLHGAIRDQWLWCRIKTDTESREISQSWNRYIRLWKKSTKKDDNFENDVDDVISVDGHPEEGRGTNNKPIRDRRGPMYLRDLCMQCSCGSKVNGHYNPSGNIQ